MSFFPFPRYTAERSVVSETERLLVASRVSETLDSLFQGQSYDKQIRPEVGRQPVEVEVGWGELQL